MDFLLFLFFYTTSYFKNKIEKILSPPPSTFLQSFYLTYFSIFNIFRFVDATVSLRMHGNIPDARNAKFNIWRTYHDDLTISDVSFYLKLNHSRLVTSTLRWRPELKSDVIVR